MAQIPGTIEITSDFYKVPNQITIAVPHITSISQDTKGHAVIGTVAGERITARETYAEVRVLISNAL